MSIFVNRSSSARCWPKARTTRMPVRFSCSMVESRPSASSDSVKYRRTYLKYKNELSVSSGIIAMEISAMTGWMENITRMATRIMHTVRTISISCTLMEKGYADLELSVHSIGGHSSRPYGGTSLGRLSGAIADITRAPFAVRLNSAMTGAFETLAPYITQEPLKTLVQDVAGNADAIAACCMGSPDLFPFVTTTIAPTMIRGGSAACNVMPQDMTAVINFRIADGDTVESVMAHCREAVQDKGVEMRFLQANDPSAIARRDGYGYRTVVESFQRYYPEAVFIPSMTVGATDAHRYEEICDTCLRCSPFMTEPAEAASGVHGTNERLLVRSYLQGIRVLIDLMEHANVEP